MAHASVRAHLMHRVNDAMMPVRGAVDALAQLQGLGAVATLDRFPGLGHGIDGRGVVAIVRRLSDPLPAVADRHMATLDRSVPAAQATSKAYKVIRAEGHEVCSLERATPAHQAAAAGPPWLARSASRRRGSTLTRSRSPRTCGSASSLASMTRNHSGGKYDSGNMPK